MRVLIVDDEAPARGKLRRMLAAFADVDIIGEAPDGASALELANDARPDVVFLDVQMPEIDGFDVAASLPDDGPALVFVTAFDQYALRAFETHACDYLLKPVEPERLERTIHRLRGVIGQSVEQLPVMSQASSGRPAASSPHIVNSPDSPSGTAESTTPTTSTAPSASTAPTASTGPTRRVAAAPTRLMIADLKGTHIVECADIEWIEAADNYVTLHVGARSLLMRRTLASLLADLGDDFVRVHRSAAVALRAVHVLRPKGKGDAVVMLKSGAEVPCSRQHRETLVARINGTHT